MSIKAKIKKTRFFKEHPWFFRLIWQFFRINWVKTIYLNFRTQDFKDAVKLPILVYGRLKIASLKGTIRIEAPIRTGMIRLGVVDHFSTTKGSTLLYLYGNLIFKGRFIALNNCLISVDCNETLSIGDICVFGGNVKVRCRKKITIGKGTVISFESQIFDTNFHYTRDIKTGRVHDQQKEIIIGDFCWVGNRTSIMKGTHLPNYSIVASNSLLNKDYTVENMECPFIAGIPAKIIGSGLVRVFDSKKEKELIKFFSDDTEVEYYQGEIGIIDESESRSRNFL
jgi:acetyltransferase-like isoleucine patch superfamily enzyme